MKVFLLKDIENVGKAGEIVSASDGYVSNYLAPRKLAIIVTDNKVMLQNKIKAATAKKEETVVKTSALAEKIAALQITIKKKMQEGGKLYGAINALEIVDLLSDNGISVSKSQIEFEKSIKSKGAHKVKIKLSSKLQPEFTLKVVEDNTAQ